MEQKNFVLSLKVQAVIQVETTGASNAEAKRNAISKLRRSYPTEDIQVLSIDAGGVDE